MAMQKQATTAVLVEQKTPFMTDHDAMQNDFPYEMLQDIDIKMDSDQDRDATTDTDAYEHSDYCSNVTRKSNSTSFSSMHALQTIRLTPTSTMRFRKFEDCNKSFYETTLLKYPGDYTHNIRYYAKPTKKYILYIPEKKMFFYGNDAHKTTMIYVKNVIISNKTINQYINKKHRNSWIKIIGKTRIALFASDSTLKEQTIHFFAEYIRQSLSNNNNNHSRLSNSDNQLQLNSKHNRSNSANSNLNNSLKMNENSNHHRRSSDSSILIGVNFDNYHIYESRECIDGLLYKFYGKNMNEMKYHKAPHRKYVIFVKSAKILIYMQKEKDMQTCTVLYVDDISRNYYDISGTNLPHKYRNSWFKVVTKSRVVMFAASSAIESEKWFAAIRHSV